MFVGLLRVALRWDHEEFVDKDGNRKLNTKQMPSGVACYSRHFLK